MQTFSFFLGKVVVGLRFTFFKCKEVRRPRFEPQPQHILCNVSINWIKLTDMRSHLFIVIKRLYLIL